ncbi:hypothetical protein [Hydrogenophaga sp. 5NK40-0174]|uniref:hypothetical protein n=1 Tax=Hydrogenophaga sp. 5NK40-0174 TaxID=3127649 RepID=UPI003102AB5D
MISRRQIARYAVQTTVQANYSATTQLGIHYSVVRLYSWPDMPKLDPELVPDVARVCALLAVRTTSTQLIPRLLDMPRQRVAHIVEMLHMHGHLQDGGSDSATAAIDAMDTLPLQNNTSDEAPPAQASLMTRLWSRLRASRRH